jgi:hypothetical protein
VTEVVGQVFFPLYRHSGFLNLLAIFPTTLSFHILTSRHIFVDLLSFMLSLLSHLSAAKSGDFQKNGFCCPQILLKWRGRDNLIGLNVPDKAHEKVQICGRGN